MWAEQSGEVILFTWLKWIEDECLSFLKITSPFPLKVVHKKSKKRAAAAAESSASSASAASAEFVTSAAPRQDSVDEADSVPSTPSTQYTNSDEPPLPHSNNNNNTNNAVKLDPRATQDVLSISDLLKLVIDYDTLERERIFNQTYQTCSVCYNEKAGSLLMELYVCKHIFCRECLGEFFSVQLQEGNVKGMVCMDPECGVSRQTKSF